MTKTNFKCMYMIDDILYKDIITKNKNVDKNIASSPFTPYQEKPTTDNYLPRDNNSVKINMDHLEHGELDRKQSKEKGTQSGIFEEIDEAKIPAKPNNEDCECMDTQDVTNDIKKFNNDEALVKRKSDENRQLQESEKKRFKQNDIREDQQEPLYELSHTNSINGGTVKANSEQRNKYSKQKELVSDDEEEWEQLRKRYNKLRYDYSDEDTPSQIPPKGKKRKYSRSTKNPHKHEDKKHVKSKDKEDERFTESREESGNKTREVLSKRKYNITKKENVTFHCSICNTHFKKFISLSNHIKRLHPEYFENWNRSNKRKNMEESEQNKKFKSDGRLKRVAETDNPFQKRRKKEFLCIFCQRYFKTETTLKRHTANQHGMDNKGEKRTNYEPDYERYSKRQKTRNKLPVTYQNYF